MQGFSNGLQLERPLTVKQIPWLTLSIDLFHFLSIKILNINTILGLIFKCMP